VAAKTCGYPAEIVKQMVAVAATGAVALVAGILVAQAYAWLVHVNAPKPVPATATATREEPHVQAVAKPKPIAPKPVAPDVRVAPASESDAAKVVLFHWPEKQDGAIGVTYGDGRTIALPSSLARKLIEDQAGKTLEQLAEESSKSR
jgi:hypothetical protein